MPARLNPLLLLLALSTLVGCELLEEKESHYATYEQAEREGAVKRGWIPAYVPRSATNIRERHDLDTNDQALRFNAPREDIKRIVAEMAPLNWRAARASGARYVEWIDDWPPELTQSGALDEEKEVALDTFVSQSISRGANCAAIDWKTLVVFAWTCAHGAAIGR
jgi:hypothetical protein